MGHVKQPESTAKKLYDDAVRKKLRMAIAASDMTVKELSRLSGIPYNTLHNILSKKHAASMFCASKLCRVLNIDANFLMGVNPEKVDK